MSLHLSLQAMLAAQSARSVFQASPQFSDMLGALTDAEDPLVISSRDSQSTLLEVTGWALSTSETAISEFFSLLGDHGCPTVEPETRQELNVAPHFGVVFYHHGVWVSALSNHEGVVEIVVRNQQAYDDWIVAQPELHSFEVTEYVDRMDASATLH